eukprot:scaffold26202_cov92-Phaeocystis_antarctica.AAC.1
MVTDVMMRCECSLARPSPASHVFCSTCTGCRMRCGAMAVDVCVECSLASPLRASHAFCSALYRLPCTLWRRCYLCRRSHAAARQLPISSLVLGAVARWADVISCRMQLGLPLLASHFLLDFVPATPRWRNVAYLGEAA